MQDQSFGENIMQFTTLVRNKNIFYTEMMISGSIFSRIIETVIFDKNNIIK
jgi:hypothetical protein